MSKVFPKDVTITGTYYLREWLRNGEVLATLDGRTCSWYANVAPNVRGLSLPKKGCFSKEHEAVDFIRDAIGEEDPEKFKDEIVEVARAACQTSRTWALKSRLDTVVGSVREAGDGWWSMWALNNPKVSLFRSKAHAVGALLIDLRRDWPNVKVPTEPGEEDHKTVEVVTRQSDGSWLAKIASVLPTQTEAQDFVVKFSKVPQGSAVSASPIAARLKTMSKANDTTELLKAWVLSDEGVKILFAQAIERGETRGSLAPDPTLFNSIPERVRFAKVGRDLRKDITKILTEEGSVRVCETEEGTVTVFDWS